jgi:alginate O-acetyltransferase complex protein AlgI
MVFSSHIFLFLFLPLFLSAYYLTPEKYRSWPIVIGSYIFYAWWRVDFTLLFAGVTIWNYLIYKQIVRGINQKRWMQLGVAGNLLTLGFFKYVGFGVESFNASLSVLGIEPISLASIILPIGVSFYIFQAISFLIDIYRKDAPRPKNFIEFAAYLSLFPQLIAGPILRYKDMAPQFQSRTHTFDKFSEGAYRFMVGFIQKVFIADSIAPLSDKIFALQNPTLIESWLGVFAFSAQLYFDFLGYSSMAIGLGLMMGFRFIENFNHPYLARCITDFWRRWHISLSTWLKDYLYIPLGGNRRGKIITYRNLMVTMFLGGLWHGANWVFALWGLWHGILLIFERALGFKNKTQARWMIILTLILVMIGWVLFRSEDLNQALDFYQGMIGLQGIGISDAFSWQNKNEALFFLSIGWFIIFIQPKFFEYRQKINGSNAMKTTGYQRPLVSITIIVLFIVSVLKLTAESYSPFLYFQF